MPAVAQRTKGQFTDETRMGVLEATASRFQQIAIALELR